MPVSRAITLLKAAAAELNPFVARHHEAANCEPVAPATAEAPLTVAPTAMLASYADGGRYRIHSDNSCGEGGSRLNWRELTAIVYANPDWAEDYGGGESNCDTTIRVLTYLRRAYILRRRSP